MTRRTAFSIDARSTRTGSRHPGLSALGIGCVMVLASLMSPPPSQASEPMETRRKDHHLTPDHRVVDIVQHPAFKGFGELLLPWADNAQYLDTPLARVGSLMPYHGHVDANVVVGALNKLIDEADAGKTIFHDLYTERQKREDPDKRFTGLFFYRGTPGAPFAIVCPGGGFSYVGSLHEGFPLAREISEEGLNAFVLRYRVDEQKATEDLAAAVAYVFRNAERLGVGTRGYSLWGCSAGARMVGNIALRGVASYGGGDHPGPATAVIAYTGQGSSSRDFPPCFITVSEDDRIVNAATVERRVRDLERAGVEVEFHKYRAAGHGFGLGLGTEAEGWIGQAIAFWTSHRSG